MKSTTNDNPLVKLSRKHPVLLFDSDCLLCSKSIQWIIKRDKKQLFRYSSLQNENSLNLLKEFDIPGNLPDTAVLIWGGKLKFRSDVTIEILRQLGNPWRWMSYISIIPKFIRDGVYNLIAKSRYTLFGKQKNCLIPNSTIAHLFIS